MTKARRHHYVPQFYLAGFSKSGGSKSKIHVIDKNKKIHFETSPLNIAVKRDFNKITIKGKEDAIEAIMAEFEGDVAPVFKYMIKNRALPENNDFNVLMNFICLLSIRNPKLRKTFGNFQKDLAHRTIALLVSNEKIWDSLMEEMQKNTGKHAPSVSYESMRRFVKERRYKLQISTDHFVASEFKLYDKVLPILARRKWTTIHSNEKVGEFVTSDHPVTLISTCDTGSSNGVGFGMKNTEVVLPVSRFLALIGVFEDVLPPNIRAKKSHVANINGRTVNYAMNQVYSAHRLFDFMDENGKVDTSSSLLKAR